MWTQLDGAFAARSGILASLCAASLLLAQGSVVGQEGQSDLDQNRGGISYQSQDDNYGQDDSGSTGQSQRGQSNRDQNQSSFDRSNDDQQLPDERQSASGQRNQQSFQQDDQQASLGVDLTQGNGGGAEVREVHPGSPAEEAGLQPGDQILRVDGRNVTSPQQLTSMIRQQDPGATVELQILRDGRRQTLQAHLESRDETFSTRGQDAAGRQDMNRGRTSQRSWSMDRQNQDSALADRVESLERQVEQLSEQLDAMRAEAGYNRSARQSQRGQQPDEQWDRNQSEDSSQQRSSQQQRSSRNQRGDESYQDDRDDNQNFSSDQNSSNDQ